MSSFLCRTTQAQAMQTDVGTLLRVPEVISGDFWEDALGGGGGILGYCWAMQGQQGYVEIDLPADIMPDTVVFTQPPAVVSLDQGKTSPKEFAVEVSGSRTRVTIAVFVLQVGNSHSLAVCAVCACRHWLLLLAVVALIIYL